MQTHSFQAPEEMSQLLEFYAGELKRSKGHIIRQALEEYMQDLADYFEATQYKASYDRSENISLEEMKRKLGLA